MIRVDESYDDVGAQIDFSVFVFAAVQTKNVQTIHRLRSVIKKSWLIAVYSVYRIISSEKH